MVPEFQPPTVRGPTFPVQADRWAWTHDTVVHPYWAVRRLTESQLALEKAKVLKERAKDKHTEEATKIPQPYRPMPSFNCELVDQVVYNTTSGTFASSVQLTDSRTCIVKAIRNTEHIIANTELILQIDEPTPKFSGSEPPHKRIKCTDVSLTPPAAPAGNADTETPSGHVDGIS